jgi:hypothetical protein
MQSAISLFGSSSDDDVTDDEVTDDDAVTDDDDVADDDDVIGLFVVSSVSSAVFSRCSTTDRKSKAFNWKKMVRL